VAEQGCGAKHLMAARRLESPRGHKGSHGWGHASASLLGSKASSHREEGWKRSRKLIKAVPLSRDNWGGVRVN